ncbi:PAS domain S-box protein [uncultured Desulfosarcina sp.]|uniref:PAS domain S-box protein n=1 Tax=uncultured Desulfosarcina sp. TaxID=218289 RepID=UPI0029C848FB|nr:PAS domain S-box protein [uncultured Desulfosarcina sp.]
MEVQLNLAQILEGNPIPTFVVDAQCRITHWNRACELLTGIPASETLGTVKHREAFYCHKRKLMADLIVNQTRSEDLIMVYGGKVKDCRHTRNGYEGEDFFPKLGENGRWLFFTAAPLTDAEGNISGAIETFQDITDKRTAEQELRASEARYRQLFESANDAIFLLKDGFIVDCNQKALALFNSSRDQMTGLSPLDLSPQNQADGISSEDEVRRRLALLDQNKPQFFEWRFLRKDGSRFDAEVSLNRFTINGSLYGLAIIRDISLRKKMIRTIEERQVALDEKSTYLEKVNQALKASLDHREVEKRAVEENMLVNLKRFVFPYLGELETCKLESEARAYLNIVQTNLNDIVSQFSKTIFSKYIDLTPTEVRIADLIREGKNSKEIADMLALSPSSIQWHRKNVRQKLGLTNKKINLQSYLNALSE